MADTPVKEMTINELRRAMKQYNHLMTIDFRGMTKREMMDKIVSLGYTIDHKNKKLHLTQKSKAMKRKPVNVKMAEKPKPKTEEQKKKTAENLRNRVIKYVKSNPSVLNHPELRRLHKGLN
jgi:hypothetical protein